MNNSIVTDYNNQSKGIGTNKHGARNRWADFVSTSNLMKGKFGCLPAKEWLTEKIIKKHISSDFKYIACEGDSRHFNAVEKTGKRLFGDNAKVIKGQLSEIIFKSKSNSYAHFDMDYCKGFEKALDEIQYLLTNKVVKVGGFIRIVSCLRGNSNLYKEFISKQLKGNIPDKGKTIMAIQKFLNKQNKDKAYQIVDIHTYRDGAPMLQLILMRVK